MKKINLQQKNYTTSGQNYQLVIPMNYEVLIPENDSVRLLSQIMEGLNYSELYEAYSPEGRKPAVEPKILAKVIVYAYMEEVYSSRKIESSCRRDINFMWLLNGEAFPDHSTINRFRRNRLGLVVESLFYQFVRKLCELSEVNYDDLFVDGTKIEAAANRYTFVWKKAVEKNEAKMFLKIQTLAEEILKAYQIEFKVNKETLNDDMTKISKFLEAKKAEEKIEFVHGIGKRKSNLQKLTEALNSYQERQQGYDKSNEIFDGRNSYSKTDNDATFMRMKDDHMRNGQLKPGYNVQLAVEAEYVVGAGIFPNPTDTTTLIPLLERMYSYNANMKIKRFTADSGYESEENYMYLENKNIEYYIKPQTYEQQKKRSFKKNIGKRENMFYNDEIDEYTCYNQKQLKPIGTFNRKSAAGFISEVTVYECENCEGCQHKDKCTKAKGNKQIQASKTFIEKRQKSLENITSENGVLLRMNRSIQSEGAFGVLKQDRQFNRFLTRGKQNVTTELFLLCFGFNVNKLHSKIQNERCGKALHDLKSA